VCCAVPDFLSEFFTTSCARSRVAGALRFGFRKGYVMAQDRITTLFFEMFTGLPRQGPGDASSTRQALSLVPGVDSGTRALVPGCGTGAEVATLAAHAPLQIVAIDNYAPYIDELNRQAHASGIGDRVEGRVGDIQRLEFPPGSFDLIWCEGSIYVVGFETALRDWHELLTPGGHIAVTEVCWTTPAPPAECAAFWAQEYPAIDHVAKRLAVIDACGYEPVAHFALPASAWWDDYYRPLETKIADFRTRHRDETDALELAASVQREIDMWKTYSECYGYEFFVMRKR
jgi:SAM-dependent methyltransferase